MLRRAASYWATVAVPVRRQRAAAGVPDAADPVLVDEGQHILTVGVVAGDLDHGRFQVRVVDVAEGERRRDRYRTIVFGVGQGAPSIDASTGASLTLLIVQLKVLWSWFRRRRRP